ncbi:MAG TPA: hypothetical protein VMA83_12480 [Solirubrobacteraceae bacterium]|nr:hypothetical protein [Solirubrobacteraceae bacterium]
MGSGVESTQTGFSGTVNGNGVSLTTDQPVLGGSQNLTGRIEGSGFGLTVQGVNHQLLTIQFAPAQASDYNSAVAALELSPYEDPCTLRAEGHEAEFTAKGPEARKLCADLADHRTANQTWEIPGEGNTAPSAVCGLESNSTVVVVSDGGGQDIGTELCGVFERAGWTTTKAFEDERSRERSEQHQQQEAETHKEASEQHEHEEELNQQQHEEASEQRKTEEEQAKQQRENEQEQSKNEAEQRKQEHEQEEH